VTTLLNQAVTIATEAGNGGLTTGQSTALNTEFTSILSEINQIGSTTNFNGTSVFNNNSTNSVSSIQGSAAAPLATTTALKAGSVTTVSDGETGGTFVFTAGATSTVADLIAAIDGAAGTTLSTGTTATIDAVTGKLDIAGPVGDSLQVSTTEPALGGFDPTVVAGNSADVFTSDGTGTGATNTDTTINTLSAAALGLATSNLSSTTSAQSALTAITAAISTVAAERGGIGASINQLTADTGVETTEVQNLTSAQNNVQNADIASVTSNLTQYNVLEQTGFDALAQSNAAQQAVEKLLQ